MVCSRPLLSCTAPSVRGVIEEDHCRTRGKRREDAAHGGGLSMRTRTNDPVTFGGLSVKLNGNWKKCGIDELNVELNGPGGEGAEAGAQERQVSIAKAPEVRCAGPRWPGGQSTAAHGGVEPDLARGDPRHGGR